MIYDDLETLRQAAQVLAVQVPKASDAMLEVSEVLWCSLAEGGELPEPVQEEAAELAEQLDSQQPIQSLDALPTQRQNELVNRLSRIAQELECKELDCP